MSNAVHVNKGDSPSRPRVAIHTWNGSRVLGSEDSRSPNIRKAEDSEDTEAPKNRVKDYWGKIKDSVAWIPPKITAAHLKPVIRSSIAAWISLILFLIPRVEKLLGQASFLILISAFISPPNEPFAGVFEREVFTIFGVLISWAWSCLAIKLADLSRSISKPNATIAEIFSGQFIEAAPSIILAIFLFVGVASILFVRARLGPGPTLPATVFACICLDIVLTTAPLYPYPNYLLARSVVIPIVFHSAVSLITSVLILPETVNAQFVKRLKAVLAPLAAGIQQQNKLLHISPLSPEFDPDSFSAEIDKAENGLTPLGASARLVKRDISWGRLGGNDLRSLQMFGRKLTVRAAGMAHFFSILDTRRARFPHTPHPSTPMESPSITRGTTPADSDEEDNASSIDQSVSHDDHGSPTSLHKKRRKVHHHHRHSYLFHHPKLLREALNHSQEHHPVGVFESQRYMNIEKRLHHPNEEVLEENSVRLLAGSVEELLRETSVAMEHILKWLDGLNATRLRLRPARKMELKDAVVTHEQVSQRLNSTMANFLTDKRHIVLEPYRGALDPLRKSRHLPPHRYLFRSFLYQYELLQFCECVRDMLSDIEHLDKVRVKRQLWPPVLPLRRIFTWDSWETNEFTEKADDENPYTIPGISVESQDLGAAEPRNPDALPPSNVVELIVTNIYAFLSGLQSGNTQFALKAGILTILLSLPSFMLSSAAFSYKHKSIWAIFIAQLSMSRYRGDTIFAFVSRLISTFIGAIVGLVFWYMSSGRSTGNPYGIAAVAAVAFPILMFLRLHTPGPPTSMVIFATTITLIVGYSWQDTHAPSPSSQGFGFDIAWRRFLLVAIGVTASAIFSFLPPSTTIRRYHRTALSTTASQIGYLYCAIVSYASMRREEDGKNIIRNMIALRSKLRRLKAQTANVGYEFSLRGKWPHDRYRAVLEIQLELTFMLSHFMAVIDHLEPNWSKAFLRRSRFVDSEFLGDVLAVITMISTSLRLGTPLPQITPAPLLDRFWRDHHGLDILQQDAADRYGLPRSVTFDTLQDEQYMYFSVGVSRAHGIVSQLDRLMHATKELVGEMFHIDGVRVSHDMDTSNHRKHW